LNWLLLDLDLWLNVALACALLELCSGWFSYYSKKLWPFLFLVEWRCWFLQRVINDFVGQIGFFIEAQNLFNKLQLIYIRHLVLDLLYKFWHFTFFSFAHARSL